MRVGFLTLLSLLFLAVPAMAQDQPVADGPMDPMAELQKIVNNPDAAIAAATVPATETPAPAAEVAPAPAAATTPVATEPQTEASMDAAKAGSFPTPALPKALQDVEKSGTQLRFMGKVAGLDGWIGIHNGQPEYYYVTEDGTAVLMGILFDGKTGGLLTTQQLQGMKLRDPNGFNQLMGLSTGVAAAAATPAGDPNSPSEMLMATMQSASGFKMGKDGAPLLYAFIDPECPHCKDFLTEVINRKLIEGGKMAMRVIPVGKNQVTAQKAAYLLAIPNAGDVLLKSVSDMNGAYAQMPKGLSTTAVERNVALLLRFKFDMTPSFVYRGTDGKVKIVRGMPNDITPMLVDLGVNLK